MTPPLRALFLNDTSRNGGPGRTLCSALKHMDPRVVFRSVVVPRPGAVSELLEASGVADELRFDPHLVENPIAPLSREMVRSDYDARLPLRGARAIGNVGLGAACVVRLARRVRRERFDVLFCNGTTANFFGGLVARMTGTPTIWHVFYTELPPALARLHAHLVAHDAVRAVLCVSKPTTGQFAHVAPKVRLLHDAIDASDYDARRIRPVLRAELGLGPDVVVFGSQGRILRRKGYVEMVLAAEKAMRALAPDERRRVCFVVLGDTPGDMRPDHLAECRALVRERGLDGAFHFVGQRPDVRPYAVDFDVAVVPSVYPDPLPRSVLESMALGKPVVAFDVGGIGEMVEHEVTGHLVAGDPPDVDAMARAFVDLARDAPRRRALGLAGRARAQREYDAAPHSRALQDEIVRAARRAPYARA